MWVTIASGEGKGLSVHVEGERFVIGSGEECQLMVGDPKVDPLHAYFQVHDDGRIELHDLGSESGTFVDGERIDGSRWIEGGEKVRLGDTELLPSHERPEEPPVQVATEADAVEVMPASERRRLRDMSRAGLAAGAAALVLAIAGVIVALSAGGGGTSAAAIVKDARDKTVVVHARMGKAEALGSGWVVDAGKGLIATDFHVINGGTSFAAGKPGSEEPATIVGAAPCDDLAVLKVSDAKGLSTMSLASQKAIHEGDSVVAIGYPANASLNDNLTSTAGVVSVVRSSFRFPTPDSPQYPNMIQTDAALSPGNSGGPLIDDDKKLVGMNTAILVGIGGEPVQGQGYAIGVDRVKQLLPDLRDGKSHGWAGFGVRAPKKSELARVHASAGVLIGGAVPGTPAYRAGLRAGPVLVTQINGLRLSPTLASYCDAVHDVRPGDTAVLTVIDKPGARPRQLPIAFR
ncbi:MAG: trypsin-like peptidase domain-containing protein [Thermoleophilaceae bacterium]